MDESCSPTFCPGYLDLKTCMQEANSQSRIHPSIAISRNRKAKKEQEVSKSVRRIHLRDILFFLKKRERCASHSSGALYVGVRRGPTMRRLVPSPGEAEIVGRGHFQQIAKMDRCQYFPSRPLPPSPIPASSIFFLAQCMQTPLRPCICKGIPRPFTQRLQRRMFIS